MINPMDLTGKHILVTGASSGIGRETAMQLSRLGARLSLIARREQPLRETMEQLEGEGHACFPYDLGERDGISDLLRAIVAGQGKADGLAYCAGVEGMYPLKLLKPEHVDQAMAVNVFSFVEMMRHLSGRRLRNEHFSAVAISSVLGQRGETAKTLYCMSKAALDNAARAMARELGPAGVRVNTVVPSWVQTAMREQYQDKVGDSEQAYIQRLQYLGIGEPIDVANAIAFLLSDAARFITGTQMVVDGGYLS